MDKLAKIVIFVSCLQLVTSDVADLKIQKPEITKTGKSETAAADQTLNIISPDNPNTNSDVFPALTGQSDPNVPDAGIDALIESLKGVAPGDIDINSIMNSFSSQEKSNDLNIGATSTDDNTQSSTGSGTTQSAPFRNFNRQFSGNTQQPEFNSLLSGSSQGLPNFDANQAMMPTGGDDDSSFNQVSMNFGQNIPSARNFQGFPGRNFDQRSMTNSFSNFGDDDNSGFSIDFGARNNLNQRTQRTLPGSVGFQDQFQNIMNQQQNDDDNSVFSTNFNNQRQSNAMPWMQGRMNNDMRTFRFDNDDNSFSLPSQTSQSTSRFNQIMSGFQNDDNTFSFDSSTNSAMGQLNIPRSWQNQNDDDGDSQNSLNNQLSISPIRNSGMQNRFNFRQFQFDDDDNQFTSSTNDFSFRSQPLTQRNFFNMGFGDDDNNFGRMRFGQQNNMNNLFLRSSRFTGDDDDSGFRNLGIRQPFFRHRIWRSFGDDDDFFRPRMFRAPSIFYPPRNLFFRRHFPRRHGIFRTRLIVRPPLRPFRLF